MTYRPLVFAIACLLHSPAIWAQDLPQKSEDDLPLVNELLDKASTHVESLEPSLEKAYLYRQLAALLARSQDMDAAYSVLKKIQIPMSAYPQTVENLKRVGFLEMVEDVALHRDTESAIKIVDESPDEYRAYADDALGRIALSASQRRDSEGAWNAIAGIKEPKGLYPYELVVAATLDDKVRGRRILLEKHSDMISAIEGRKLMAREEWAGILWMLAFYKWCDLNDESEQLLNSACQTTSNPDESRAEVLGRLGRTTTETDEPKETEANSEVSRESIAQMVATVDELKTPEQKSERLLATAKLLLEFGHTPIVPNCD